MKKIIKFMIIILFFGSCGHFKSTQSNIIPVSKIVTINNVAKNELFVRANNWMISTFKDARSSIQFTDKENGTITGKYLLGTISKINIYNSDRHDSDRYAYAIISIKVKEEASKITINPYAFHNSEGNPYPLYTEEDARLDIDELISSFEKFILESENNDL
jgi:hypothetical protein